MLVHLSYEIPYYFFRRIMISSGAEFRVIESITMMALAKFLGHMVKIVVKNRIVQSIRLAGAAPVDEEVLAQPLPEGSPPPPS